jgi:hypothetical protein
LNFQHAIRVTRKLGLRYLWIDSLCIIQDDDADWKEEAANMGHVYASAYLTLAATNSRSTHEGFLQRDIKPQDVVIMPYQSHKDDAIKGEFYLRCRSGSIQQQDIVTSNWNTRGWTFQERLLSARVLHFCKERMCFECRGCDFTEDSQAPYVTQQAYWLTLDPNMPKQWMDHHIDEEEPHRTYRLWHSMIERYTDREFTFQNDLLPAILGLTNEMKTTIKDECVWGLWKSCFPRGMLWCRQTPIASSNLPSSFLTRPSKKRAPSWSWMSVNGPVRWNIMNYAYNSQSEFGLSITDTKTIDVSSPWAIQVQAKVLPISPCIETEKNNIDYSGALQLFYNNIKVGIGYGDAKDLSLDNGDIWLLEVETINKSRNLANNLAGLLLRPSTDHMDGFYRVGFALIDSDSSPFLNCEYRTIFLV